jgi:septal ring factor EnvC (AmiA/AmiB activator)
MSKVLSCGGGTGVALCLTLCALSACSDAPTFDDRFYEADKGAHARAEAAEERAKAAEKRATVAEEKVNDLEQKIQNVEFEIGALEAETISLQREIGYFDKLDWREVIPYVQAAASEIELAAIRLRTAIE